MQIPDSEKLANITGLLRRTKNAYDRAAVLQADLFDLLTREYNIDLSTPAPLAENADDLETAITTYLLYSEVGEQNLLKMLKEALSKTED